MRPIQGCWNHCSHSPGSRLVIEQEHNWKFVEVITKEQLYLHQFNLGKYHFEYNSHGYIFGCCNNFMCYYLCWENVVYILEIQRKVGKV